MTVWVATLVVVAGALGALARFLIDAVIKGRFPAFPWATAAINVTGSLLLGVLTGLVARGAAPESLAQIAGTGFCGGYTTFSTASVETVRLAMRTPHRRGVPLALANAVLVAVASVLACAGGLALAGR